MGTSPTTATETLWSKENHTENSKIENAKEKAESFKIEQSVKTNFFEALPWLKWKNAKLIKVLQTYKDHAQTFSDQSDFFPGRDGQNGDGKIWLTGKSVLVQKSKSGTNFN